MRALTPDRGRQNCDSGSTALVALCLQIACAWVLACGAGIPQTLPEHALSPNERETYARRHLETARGLQKQGRLEAAHRVVERGLALQPEEPALLRLKADLLA
ncbi:MAG: hypothetical protein MJE66_04230, partial [Proteobacteria bacterium]|nr:hypothetical protein [Pseudomonadota bacterium]